MAAVLDEIQMRLREARQLNEEVGILADTVQSNATLKSLADLLFSPDGVSALEVRFILVSVLRGACCWWSREPEDIAGGSWLKSKTEDLLKEYERWTAG